MTDRESLLAHCLEGAARAVVRENLEAGRDPDVPPSRRETAKALWATTRLGTHAATLIVEWALALDELGTDELGAERFVEWSFTSRSTVYRRLDDFRRVWPEHHTPNELARVVLIEARRRGEKPASGTTLVAA
jgi:hypothetical protein